MSDRERKAREECTRRGIDPDDICADGGIEAWMVVDQGIRGKRKGDDMSENKADPLREALKPLAAISLWRDKYQDGPDMLTNDKLARYFTADQVRAARAALAAPQPAADSLLKAAFKLSCQDQFDLATAIAANVGYVLVVEPQPDRVSIPSGNCQQEAVVAAQPAAPLGGREAVARIVDPGIWGDDPDVGYCGCHRCQVDRDASLAKADAILAAVAVDIP